MYNTRVHFFVFIQHPYDVCIYVYMEWQGQGEWPTKSYYIIVPTSTGEDPGCVYRVCTLERVLADVRASKCVHMCMPDSMFV